MRMIAINRTSVKKYVIMVDKDEHSKERDTDIGV